MATTLTTPTPRRIDAGLLLLRLVVGAVFIAHGAQKLFVFGLGGATNAFTQMGVPMPTVTAPLVAFVELFGGIALIIGLLTRLAAFGVAMVMVGAILFARLGGGFFAPNGFEFELTLMGAALALVLAGPGDFSIDRAIARRRGAL